MGHCEMLLEVAGFDKEAIAERAPARQYDWPCFRPTEQPAFALALKLP
jgi:hypothetical protein